MQIKELYKEYKNKLGNASSMKKDDLDDLFNDSFSFTEVSTSEAIVIVKHVMDECTSENSGIFYLDKTLFSISKYITCVSVLTDLEFEQADDGSFSIEEYDLLKRMEIGEYLSSRYKREYLKLIEIFDTEEENFNKTHSLSFIASKAVEELSNNFSSLINAITTSVENFDPSNIEVAQALLNKMNDSVKEIKNISR